MMNKLKLLSSSFIMALTLAAPFATYAMEPEKEDHIAEATKQVPLTRKEKLERQLESWEGKLEEVKASSGKKRNKSRKIQHAFNIIKEVRTELTKLDKYNAVAKKAAPAPKRFELYTYMVLGLGLEARHMNAIYHSTPELHPDHPNHYVYKRFLNGKLIYKPNWKSNEGMVVMPFSDLANPLEGEFDLSKCGDAGKYLSINTGYRKGERPENAGKIEIWFAPHFLIKKNLEGSASHFKSIMRFWDTLTGPVGTFFTWGALDNLGWYDYATTLSWESYNDPENNLRMLLGGSGSTLGMPIELSPPSMEIFHLIFDEVN